jgi:hypothetical protein
MPMPDVVVAQTTQAPTVWERLAGLPVVVWVAIVGVAAMVLLLVRVAWIVRRNVPEARAAEFDLKQAADALRAYAAEHGGALPGTLSLVVPELADRIVYRPVPAADCDPKLLIAYNKKAAHQVAEFPTTRRGRGVLFLNWRLHVVTDEAFEKLIEADDRLRDKLGLERIQEHERGNEQR